MLPALPLPGAPASSRAALRQVTIWAGLQAIQLLHTCILKTRCPPLPSPLVCLPEALVAVELPGVLSPARPGEAPASPEG